MGIRIDALVFPRLNKNENEIKKVVNQLIEQSLLTYQDFDKDINVDVNDEIIIINNFPALNIIHNSLEWEKIFSDLGLSNEWLIALVYFDFSDTYGYTIYEKGCHLRTLFYSANEPNSQITLGNEQPFENKFLHSPIVYLNMEDGETYVTNLEQITEEKDCYFPAIVVDEGPLLLTEAYMKMFSQCSLKYLGIDLSEDYISDYQRFSFPIECNLLTKELNKEHPSSLFSKILGLFKK